jgi:hypothetical protein
MNNKEWYIGRNNFKKCTYETGTDSDNFTLEIIDQEFEDKDLELILLDNLLSLSTKKVEVLFSGGADSELLLRICKKHNIDCTATIMKVYANGFLHNTHDLYYAEKFVRENDIKHRFLTLDAVDFYTSGKYLDYLLPLNIEKPNVASHFWLIEQCYDFPIMGGDWPWVHTGIDNKKLSPQRYAYHAYELFLRSRNIDGMSNFLGYSYASTFKLIDLHITAVENLKKTYNESLIHSPLIKKYMFNLEEPRIKTDGWTWGYSTHNTFTLSKYETQLQSLCRPVKNVIKWNEKVKQLLNTNINVGDSFG